MKRCIPLVCVALALTVPSRGAAQTGGGLMPGWEATGQDFHPDGVWRRRGVAVSQWRAGRLASRDLAALNGPEAATAGAAAPGALGGILRIPALLFAFKNSAVKAPFPAASYDQLLFGPTPPAGRPYTLRGYYEELSDTIFSLGGQSYGWVVLPLDESAYTGAPGTCPWRPNGNCNGIWTGSALSSLQQGLAAVVTAVDPQVDFGQFDNDGDDGIPNSGDDDGYVDVLMFLHAEQDGACGGATNNHPWAHRSQMSAQTQDPAAGGGTIRIRDYIILSGVGGSTSCDTSQPTPIGLAAHELAHGLGLPDLYDTGDTSEGIGEWGLLGSGLYASPLSPARMESWSLNELGWVTLAPADADATYSFGPAPVSDTAFIVYPVTPSLRNEYFLLENRQRVQADSAVIRQHCAVSGSPPGCSGGLLIWHIDPQKIAATRQLNGINAGAIHGVNLVEADNFGQLRNKINRGDGGDLYPGTSANTQFSGTSLPAARLNLLTNGDGAEAGFSISGITQLAPDGPMSFRLLVDGHYRIAATDSRAEVRFDGTPYPVFQSQLEPGTVHQIGIDSPQLADSGRTRLTFTGWSDAGAQTHDITVLAAGDTIIAGVSREFQLAVLVSGSGSGTVTPAPAVPLTGTFFPDGTTVSLSADADPGSVFAGWTGDTTTASSSLVLSLTRPWTVSAAFHPFLSISSSGNLPPAVMGTPYTGALLATGGSGTYDWSLTGGALPSGVTLGAAGSITGIPTDSGAFQFTAVVTSGVQSQTQTFSMQVGTPALAPAAIVAQLLTGSGGLTADDLRFLDLIGNRNGGFDLGDFLAWVDATGAPGAAAEALTALQAARRTP